AKVDGNYYYASRYGTRSTLFELKAASVLGVAVDDRLAVLDSPVSVPEIGQRLAGVPINKTCFVSGNSTTIIGEGVVTERENAPIQVGNELIALCSSAHAAYVE